MQPGPKLFSLTPSIPNTGSFEWTIPKTINNVPLNGYYKLIVVSCNLPDHPTNCVSDYNDSPIIVPDIDTSSPEDAFITDPQYINNAAVPIVLFPKGNEVVAFAVAFLATNLTAIPFGAKTFEKFAGISSELIKLMKALDLKEFEQIAEILRNQEKIIENINDRDAHAAAVFKLEELTKLLSKLNKDGKFLLNNALSELKAIGKGDKLIELILKDNLDVHNVQILTNALIDEVQFKVAVTEGKAVETLGKKDLAKDLADAITAVVDDNTNYRRLSDWFNGK